MTQALVDLNHNQNGVSIFFVLLPIHRSRSSSLHGDHGGLVLSHDQNILENDDSYSSCLFAIIHEHSCLFRELVNISLFLQDHTKISVHNRELSTEHSLVFACCYTRTRVIPQNTAIPVSSDREKNPVQEDSPILASVSANIRIFS